MMTTPVQVDVFAIMPENWRLCRTCEAFMTQADLSRSSSRSDLDAYPQAWLAEFNQLSRLIERVSLEFGDQVTLRIYDPRAPDGLVKAIRHRIRRYPAFLVAGKQHLSGLDWNPLRQAIELARSQVG